MSSVLLPTYYLFLLQCAIFLLAKGEFADLDDLTGELDHSHHDHEDECTIGGDDVLNAVTESVFNDLPQLNVTLCSHQEGNCTSELYTLVSEVLLRLNVTTRCCLDNGTHCGHDHHDDWNASTAEIYGYGFLMILGVSACAFLGVLIVPMVQGKGASTGQLYKYIYSLMIALGASALFCDAILHLIPEAFSLHGHSHSEEEEGEEEDQSFIWKGCVIIAGTYCFFLFETILHKLTSSTAPHPTKVDTKTDPPPTDNDNDSSSVDSEECLLSDNDKTADKRYGSTKQQAEAKRRGLDLSHSDPEVTTFTDLRGNCFARTVQYLLRVKPLAWLIILGDAIHNFADGLALGAAIAQSLSLGLSTMIALVFHEIPHELGDFVILLSTGMKWYTALVFNVLSQITGIIGFFIGVAISTTSEDANGWILAVAAGVFLYIALVDLLPGLMHMSDRGGVWWGRFGMVNIGFLLSFTALILLAIFEDQLNGIIS